MPNVVPCTLVVRGEVEDIEEFLNDIDLEKGILRSILPCPLEPLHMKSLPYEDEAYEAFFGDATGMLGLPWVVEAGITCVDELRAFLMKKVPGIYQHCLIMRSNAEKYGFRTGTIGLLTTMVTNKGTSRPN